MNRRSRPGTAARRRTRYNARRRLRLGRAFRTIGLALLLSVLACSGIYREVFAPPVSQAVSMITPVVFQDTPVPASPTAEPSSTVFFTPTAEPTASPTAAPTLAQAEIIPTPAVSPSPSPSPAASAPILYYTQAGDTLAVVAYRFGVTPEEIVSPEPLPTETLLNPGILLLIPRRLGDTSAPDHLMPDSEVAFSPSAVDFDVEAYVAAAGGYLSTYSEYLGSTGSTTGAKVVKRVAVEYSVNPRLLLSLIEYQSHWVYGQPQSLAETDYPLGYIHYQHKGLYKQLAWAVGQLSLGYYGWREGLINELTFPDGGKLHLAPDLNAGTVALQYMFSKLYNQLEWAGTLNPESGLPAQHARLFGDPWLRAAAVEPIFPATLTQPVMELPFMPEQVWSFSGGPHAAFGVAGARAALDFAPGSTEQGCVKSYTWATAAATGLVVRSERGVVVVDLDGDGYEQTGWSLLYLHIESDGRVPVGTWVGLGDKIGHPSCEGGFATGTHIHIARKYNGEWILADGPIPFTLSSYVAHAGANEYEGTMTKGDEVVKAATTGAYETRIMRPKPQ